MNLFISEEQGVAINLDRFASASYIPPVKQEMTSRNVVLVAKTAAITVYLTNAGRASLIGDEADRCWQAILELRNEPL